MTEANHSRNSKLLPARSIFELNASVFLELVEDAEGEILVFWLHNSHYNSAEIYSYRNYLFLHSDSGINLCIYSPSIGKHHLPFTVSLTVYFLPFSFSKHRCFFKPHLVLWLQCLLSVVNFLEQHIHMFRYQVLKSYEENIEKIH